MSNKLVMDFEHSKTQSSKHLEVLGKIVAGTIVQVKLKPISGSKPQSYTGICISYKRKGIASSLLLRNFIAGEAVEYTVYPYSNGVDSLSIVNYAKLNYKYRRAKLYYLRNRTPKESTVTLK